MRKWQLLRISFLFCVSACFPAMAGRSLKVITYEQSLDGQVDTGLPGPNAADGALQPGFHFAYSMTAEITLLNVSNIQQTGSVVVENDSVFAGILTRTGYGATNCTKLIRICSGTNSTMITPGTDASVNYTLPADGKTVAILQYVCTGTMPALDSNNFRQAWFQARMLPVITIKVNENLGAMLGSYVGKQAPWNDRTWNMCNGYSPNIPSSTSQAGFANSIGFPTTGVAAMNNPRIPLLLNGGRPF